METTIELRVSSAATSVLSAALLIVRDPLLVIAATFTFSLTSSPQTNK